MLCGRLRATFSVFPIPFVPRPTRVVRSSGHCIQWRHRLPHGPPWPEPGTLETLRAGLRLIALRSLSDPDAADEVVQETLARGLTAFEEGRLQNPTKIGAYFRGIARHVIADMLRDRSRTESLAGNAETATGHGHTDALAVLISREDKARVVRALAALDPRSRECLTLSFYEGLTPAQIAKRLSEPAPRVRKRHSRALQYLRAAFFSETSGESPARLTDPNGHDPGRCPTLLRNARPSDARRASLPGPNDAGAANER